MGNVKLIVRFSWRIASLVMSAIIFANLFSRLRIVSWNMTLFKATLEYYHDLRNHALNFLLHLVNIHISQLTFDVVILYLLFGNGFAALRYYETLKIKKRIDDGSIEKEAREFWERHISEAACNEFGGSIRKCSDAAGISFNSYRFFRRMELEGYVAYVVNQAKQEVALAHGPGAVIYQFTWIFVAINWLIMLTTSSVAFLFSHDSFEPNAFREAARGVFGIAVGAFVQLTFFWLALFTNYVNSFGS